MTVAGEAPASRRRTAREHPDGPVAPYQGSYGSAALARWAGACAPHDALRLLRMAERRCSP